MTTPDGPATAPESAHLSDRGQASATGHPGTEREEQTDEETVIRTLDAAGRVERERRVRTADGMVLGESWIRAGARALEVTPLTREGRPVWSCWGEHDGIRVAGDARPTNGRLTGVWRVSRPDGSIAEVRIADWSGLLLTVGPETSAVIAALATVPEWTPPSALDRFAALPWDDLEWDGAGVMDSEDFRRIIPLLAHPDPVLARTALRRLAVETAPGGPVGPEAALVLEYGLRVACMSPVGDEIVRLLLDAATAELDFVHVHVVRRALRAGAEPTGDLTLLPLLDEHAAHWAELARDGSRIGLTLLGLAPESRALLHEVLADLDPTRLAEGAILLGFGRPETDAATASALLDHADPLVRFGAALALGLLGGEVPAAAVSVLADALLSPAELDAYPERCMLATGTAAADAARVAGHLPPEQAAPLLDRLIDLLAETEPVAAIGVCEALLDLLFPEVAYGPGHPLTERHRRVFAAIADTGPVWESVELDALLRMNGLPTTPEELRALA